MSQQTSLSYQNVYDFIKDNGCLLLSKKYINMKKSLKIQCSCGNIFEMNFDTFKFKKQHCCKKCSNKQIADRVRLSYNHVKEYIIEHGCELISDNYISAREKLQIKCKCGNIFERSFNKFKSGQTQCKICSGRRTWNYKTVKNFIEIDSKSNCKLLSSYYKNREQTLNVECSCGNSFTTDFHSFLNANQRKCSVCSMKDKKRKLQKGIDYLKSYVKDNSNCTLLSDTYIDYNSPLIFKCSCGRNFTTSFLSFINGKRLCNICSPNSKLEKKAEIYFIDNNIEYISQYRFDDCKDKYTLPFDFAIFKNNRLHCLIELDGEQHFKPFDGFGGIEKFKVQHYHDELKNDYCLNNQIPLYRIPFTQLNNINNILSKLVS